MLEGLQDTNASSAGRCNLLRRVVKPRFVVTVNPGGVARLLFQCSYPRSPRFMDGYCDELIERGQGSVGRISKRITSPAYSAETIRPGQVGNLRTFPKAGLPRQRKTLRNQEEPSLPKLSPSSVQTSSEELRLAKQ